MLDAINETAGEPMAVHSNLTRNDAVRREGAHAAARGWLRRDNPYRPGSADWRAWMEGFEA